MTSDLARAIGLEPGAEEKMLQPGENIQLTQSAIVLENLISQLLFKGASDALEGKHGFMRAYAPDPKPERAVQDLGKVFELMNTAVKPYPSCRYGHAGIDAALFSEVKPNPAIQQNRMFYVFARNCRKVSEPHFDGAEDIAVHLVPLEKIPSLVARCRIHHALVATAFYFLDAHLKKK